MVDFQKDPPSSGKNAKGSQWIEFTDIYKFSKNFVDSIISDGLAELQSNIRKSSSTRSPKSFIISKRSSEDVISSPVSWPSLQDFTIELGKKKIAEYIEQNWYYEEPWLYCIDFLLNQSDQVSDYFLYEAKFSIPTRSYPVPQATASVYFTIEVSRIQPPFLEVQVTYVFEGNTFKHEVDEIEFQEKWLFDIVDAKLKLFQMITF